MVERVDAVLAELDTANGVERAAQWYARRRRELYERTAAEEAPNWPASWSDEMLFKDAVYRVARLRDERERVERLEAAPAFPGLDFVG